MVWDVLEIASAIHLGGGLIRRVLLPLLLIAGLFLGGACIAVNVVSWAFPPKPPITKATLPDADYLSEHAPQSQPSRQYDKGRFMNGKWTEPKAETEAEDIKPVTLDR